MIRLKARWKWFIKELSKTDGRMWFLTLFFSIILLIAAFILLVLAGHFLNTNFRDLPPLPDLGHQILPLWDLRFLFQIGLIASLIVFISTPLKYFMPLSCEYSSGLRFNLFLKALTM